MNTGTTTVNAREFRAMADRCRELHRIAIRDEVREQLRQWAIDLDAEADALEKTAPGQTARYSGVIGNKHR